jgi:hypothetical protein
MKAVIQNKKNKTTMVGHIVLIDVDNNAIWLQLNPYKKDVSCFDSKKWSFRVTDYNSKPEVRPNPVTKTMRKETK